MEENILIEYKNDRQPRNQTPITLDPSSSSIIKTTLLPSFKLPYNMSADGPHPRDAVKRDIPSPTTKGTCKAKKVDSSESKNAEGDTLSDEKKKTPGGMLPRQGKVKTYMMPPLEDPEKERKRKNAIVAYDNRIRKKRENENLQEEVKRLKETNDQLHAMHKQRERKLSECNEERERLQILISGLHLENQSLKAAIQSQQEKLTFIREHIKMINTAMEENHPIRRLLIALLDTLIPSSYSTVTPPISPR